MVGNVIWKRGKIRRKNGWNSNHMVENVPRVNLNHMWRENNTWELKGTPIKSMGEEGGTSFKSMIGEGGSSFKSK